MCPNCTRGCKLIKLCFITAAGWWACGGEGVEQGSNTNRDLEWFALNGLWRQRSLVSPFIPLAFSSVPCLGIHACPPSSQSTLDGSNVKTGRRNCALEPGCISRTGFGNSLPWPWKVELETSACGPPWEELDVVLALEQRSCIQIIMPDTEPFLLAAQSGLSPKWQACRWENILEIKKKKRKKRWQAITNM